jgi:hypothetical protein
MKGFILTCLFAAAVILGMVLFLPVPAYSQVLMNVPVYCVPGKPFIDRLKGRFSENLIGSGITDGVLTQLYRSKKSWTILILNPNGMACTIAYGTDWETVVVIEGEPS